MEAFSLEHGSSKKISLLDTNVARKTPIIRPSCRLVSAIHLSDKKQQATATQIAKKILLVEDTPILQKLNTMLLQQMGYCVVLAGTGSEAIKLFNQGGFDLVLLDIGLPDISGIEVATIIRQQSKQLHVPIIALTAFSSNDIKTQCYSAGVNDFLVKPAAFDVLKKAIEHRLKIACS